MAAEVQLALAAGVNYESVSGLLKNGTLGAIVSDARHPYTDIPSHHYDAGKSLRCR